jgi:ASC-1-like (ASCH) protein
MEAKYIEHVSEPWFSLISSGLKIVEGRKNKGRFSEIVAGDVIKWMNDDFGQREVTTIVTGVQKYGTFREYLESEGLDECLPGVKDINAGEEVYYQYYTRDDERIYGVVAILLKII